MRRIDQNDFEAANVEYIQFWMMDPFNEDYEGTPQSGKLYFNLGNVSEDVMTDGLNLYEQLLPDNEAEANNVGNDTTSAWGRTTTGTPFADGFDNLAGSRPFQDAGLDGLASTAELAFYQDFIDEISTIITSPDPENNELARLQVDPSSDNYNYFRDDDYDAAGLNILERYKNFNGTEGNSPTEDIYQAQNADGYSTAASIRPDEEDINADNIVNPVEAYYQYAVDLSPNAINPENVGSNFITDVLTTEAETDAGKRNITWYQFRIPVRTPNKTRHGEINDFRSIRFMRMFMKGFTNPMHLRFARLELVRGEWRKYLGEIDNNPEGITKDSEIDFNVGAVNIEENAGKSPVNYVLPPDIQREQNINTTNLQQINEQSLQMTVCGLEDGQAVASYRNTTLDLRQYGTLKMYVHAESLADNEPIDNNEITVFIRLGTDFTDHYYEYEIPVFITAPGTDYQNNIKASQLQVWPEFNNIEIDIKALTELKLRRDKVILDGGSETNRKRRFFGNYQRGTIYVVGNPNLGEVKTIMIGIRNPRKTETSPDDDGLPKCAEVWVNELRMSNFDKTKGWATVGNANLKMADLVNFNVTAGMSTPGWGSLDKKVAERQQETKKQFSTTAAMNLDKFLPKDWGVKVPMYASYGIEIEEPRYSPLAPDIEFDDYLDAWETKTQKDSVKKITQDRLVRRSINFTNVRKEKNRWKG